MITQTLALEEYAQEHDGVVARSYTDESENWLTDKRPQFQQMVADALADDCPFDEILVWKYSRFARNREDATLCREMLRDLGIEVTYIKEQADDVPVGGLLEGIIEVFEETGDFELARQIARFKQPGKEPQ